MPNPLHLAGRGGQVFDSLERLTCANSRGVRYSPGPVDADGRRLFTSGNHESLNISMIVDVHTHTPRHRVAPASTGNQLDAKWRPDQKASTVHTWDEHVNAMEGVDRAIVFNIASDPRGDIPDDGQLIYQTPDVNNDTAAFAQANPEKFIGFLTVHPHQTRRAGGDRAVYADLGLRGIKLGPNYQNFDPWGRRLSPSTSGPRLGITGSFPPGNIASPVRRSRLRASTAYGQDRDGVSGP